MRERRAGARRGLGGLGCLVVVLVLGGGALVAAPVLDGAARDAAEERVAALVAEQTGATGPVAVVVEGGWFVPQLVRGEYPLVRVRAQGVPTDGPRLERVSADLRDVEAPLSGLLGGDPRVRVGSTGARVLVTAQDVNAQLQAQERALQVATTGEGGRLRVTTSAEVAGRELGLTGWVELRLDGDRLQAVPTGLDVDDGGPLDRLSAVVLGRLEDRLAFDLPLAELPFDQRVTGVEVTTEGVVLRTAGDAIIVAGS